MFFSRAILLAALCLASASAHAANPSIETDHPVDWGPLTVRSMAPVWTNRLAYTPGRVIPLDDGVGEAQVVLSHVNDWAQMPGYFFDGEWTRLSLRLGYGLGWGTEVQAELPLYGRMGGFLDNFIMGFHDAFGVTQARRNLYPKNQLRVVTYDSDGTHVWLTNQNAGVGLGNPSLGVKKQLTDRTGGWPMLVAELLVKLPVGSIADQFASADWAGLMDLAVQQTLGYGFGIYGAAGLVFSPGDGRIYGMQQALIQKFLLAALEWRALNQLSIVLHYLNQDGAVELCTYKPLNQTTHEFALGIKWAPGGSDRWLVEAGILENSVHDANTPDFGLHTALRRRF